MRTASSICSVIALALLGFAWWGLGTAAGQHAYDEMAGMVPFGAGVLGVALSVVALVLRVVALWQRR